jgi:predicted MPP superfamily phosphohydrolase
MKRSDLSESMLLKMIDFEDNLNILECLIIDLYRKSQDKDTFLNEIHEIYEKSKNAEYILSALIKVSPIIKISLTELESLFEKNKCKFTVKQILSNDSNGIFNIITKLKQQIKNTSSLKILHISDLHFGKYHSTNRFEDSPTLKLILSLNRLKITFDYLLITGDITSESKDTDYRDFFNFIKKLKKSCIRRNKGNERSNRIILIPGNHDVLWHIETLSTDNLSKFKKQIRKMKFITPYSKDLNNNEERIISNKNTPAFSIYYNKTYNMLIFCLISAYYSGSIKTDNKLRQLVKSIIKYMKNKNNKIAIENLIRVDCGRMGTDYILSVKNTIQKIKDKIGESKYDSALKLGIIHHGKENTLKELKQYFIQEKHFVILCGHEHKFDISQNKEIKVIKCGTLSGIYQEDTGVSCNLYEIKEDNGTYKLKINRIYYDGEFFKKETGKLLRI